MSNVTKPYRPPFNNMPGPGDPETWGPCAGHPLDPRTVHIEETAAYEEAKDSVYREKVSDIGGYFIESIGEASDEWLKELSQLCIKWGDSPSDKVKDVELEIGRLVARRVDEYCDPGHEEIMAYLERFEND